MGWSRKLRPRGDDRGVTTVEFAIIVAGVAIVAVPSIFFLQQGLRDNYQASSSGAGVCSTPGCNAATSLGGDGIPAGPVVLNGYNPTSWKINTAVTASPAITGGTAPYSFVITGTLPTGVALSSATTGVLAGTPATLGSYPVSVTVTDDNGATSTKNVTFVVTSDAVPVITALSEDEGDTNGGISTTITGTDFDPSATVSIGGRSAPVTASSGTTSLTVTVPARAASGSTDVIVSNPGPVDSIPDTFTYTLADPPTISGVTPVWGPAGSATSVTVTGSGFVTVSGGSLVKVGSTNCTSQTLGSTTATCSISGGSAGAVGVTVTNPDTQAVTRASSFYYVSEAISRQSDGGSVARGSSTTTGSLTPSSTDINNASVTVLMQPDCPGTANDGSASRPGGGNKDKITYVAPNCAGAAGPVVIRFTYQPSGDYGILTFTVSP